jgi:hypothetical protein
MDIRCGEGTVDDTGCDPALCGNGVLDSCLLPVYFDGVHVCDRPFTEACDGAEGVDANACLDSGFGSGSPACSTDCTAVDMSSCSGCLPSGAGVARCGDAPVPAAPFSLSMAANDDAIALAWTQTDQDGRFSVEFATLSPDLETIASSHLDGLDPSATAPTAVVAPLPAGWAVVEYLEPELFVRTLDARGVELARTTVATVSAAMLLGGPVVAARSNGGPLIVWQVQDLVKVAVLSDDGRSLSAARQIQFSFFGVGATYAGGAFYVGLPIPAQGANPSLLRLQRVELDGTPTTAFNLLPAVSSYDVRLVPGAGDLQIVYEAYLPQEDRYSWASQELDPTGTPLSDPIPIFDAAQDADLPWPIALGTDTVVAFTSSGYGSLAVERLGPDATVVTPAFEVARMPYINLAAIVRRGPDIVVAWNRSDTGGLQIARVTP